MEHVIGRNARWWPHKPDTCRPLHLDRLHPECFFNTTKQMCIAHCMYRNYMSGNNYVVRVCCSFMCQIRPSWIELPAFDHKWINCWHFNITVKWFIKCIILFINISGFFWQQSRKVPNRYYVISAICILFSLMKICEKESGPQFTTRA